MTESTLKEIVHRAVKDGSFRAELQRDPAKALAGFELTRDERSAIASGDPTRLTALGVDQRMSKAFATGILGDASKVIATDVTGSFAGGVTFIDEGSAAGGRGIVGDPIAPNTSLVEPGTSASQVRMRQIEQDLDTAGAATAEPAGEKYLTQDEALLAYQANLAASIGTSAVNSGLMAADGTSFDPGLVSADSGLVAAVDSGEATNSNAANLRRIEQDLNATNAVDVDSSLPKDGDWVDPAISPTEY